MSSPHGYVVTLLLDRPRFTSVLLNHPLSILTHTHVTTLVKRPREIFNPNQTSLLQCFSQEPVERLSPRLRRDVRPYRSHPGVLSDRLFHRESSLTGVKYPFWNDETGAGYQWVFDFGVSLYTLRHLIPLVTGRR